MKLRKIVKHFDPICTKAEIYVREYDEPVWKGDMLNLQAAADTREDKESYLKSLKEEDELEKLLDIFQPLLSRSGQQYCNQIVLQEYIFPAFYFLKAELCLFRGLFAPECQNLLFRFFRYFLL